MKLPFTTEQFFNVIEEYNVTIFPVQWIILGLGVFCLFLLHSSSPARNKLIGTFIGALWIWTGLVYHLIFFTAINKAAYVFGGIFIFQGLLILFNTFQKSRLNFNFEQKTRGYIGYFFVLYGLIIYPIVSYFVEGSLERTILIGLPCPSTIVTFGLFILTSKAFPKYLLIIPTLWAIVGLSAAINIGVVQDVMIMISALTAVIVLAGRKTISVSSKT